MKTMLFFCDIRGTITGTTDYKELINKINRLSEVYNCDKVIFSLISSENADVVLDYAKKIDEDNDNMILGKQFFDEGYIDYQKNIMNNKVKDKTKLGQVIRYSKEISDEYDLNLICYADDNAYGTYAQILGTLIDGVEVRILIPSNKREEPQVISTNTKEIDGLYECLDMAIEEKFTKDKKYCKTLIGNM